MIDKNHIDFTYKNLIFNNYSVECPGIKRFKDYFKLNALT